MFNIENLDKNLLVKSLISEVNFVDGKKIFPIVPNKINKYDCKNFIQYLTFSYDFSNRMYGIEGTTINEQLIEKILLLHNSGVKFELKDTLETQFEINSNDLLFPICCVGKNRSQFLFYYLKKLQQEFPLTFQVGYPASGDELSSIITVNKNKVLGGFTVQYKSDSFSKSIEYSFGKEVSRSIHVFDLVIRNPEQYSNLDIANLESSKYKNSHYDIFDKDSNEIKKLYIEYYLNPVNLRRLTSNLHQRITWICLSPESYNNLISVLYEFKNTNKQLDLSNTRIIYYGFNDIFQSSKINISLLEKLYLNIINTFVFSK